VAHGLAGPERYKVQFTANAEYVRLVDEAKALLSHAAPNATLDDIQLRAMRAFVAELKKQKYATTRPSKVSAAPPETFPANNGPEHPRQRVRHIPAAVRRAVAMRDAERCSYVDRSGRRCPETHCLEFHHLVPFVRDGAHSPSNVTLRCRAHNALAAEADFGSEFMAQKRASATHEPFRSESAE